MAILNDKSIKTGVRMGDDGTSKTTAAKLADEARRCVKKQWAIRHPQALMNEEYYHGNQAMSVDANNDISRDVEGLNEAEFEYYMRNYLPGILDSRVAILLEGDPAVRAWPNSGYGTDPMLAELATSILLHSFSQEGLSAKLHEVVTDAQFDGRAGLQVTWDPDRGPKNPLTGRPEGSVSYQTLNAWNFGGSGADNEGDEMWCGFRSLTDMYQARQLILDAGGGEEELGSLTVTSASSEYSQGDETDEGVETWEFWYRPSARFPSGLRIVEVGGHVVAATKLPYVHGDLPRATYWPRPKRGSSAGTSWMDDAVGIQKQHNVAVTIKMRRAMAMRKLFLLASQRLRDALDNNDDDIAVLTATEKDRFDIVSIEDPKIEVFTQLENETREALETVSGVPREAAFSADAAQSAAGKTIAFLARLHQMRFAGETRRINQMLVKVARQTLSLFKQFAPDWLIMRIVGEQYMAFVDAFRAMDLDGLDVKIEITSGQQETATATAANAEQLALQGVAPEQNAEIAETGLDDTILHSAELDFLVRQVQGVLAGEEPTSDTRVDPSRAVPIVEQLAALNAEQPNGEAVWRLLELYQQAAFNQGHQLQQATAPAPQQGPVDDFQPAAGQQVGIAGIPFQ